MIDREKYGASFSLKQCRNFGLDPRETLQWLLDQGWRRFRLMSYWNEHEKQQGDYNFTELDWQIEMISNAGGEITLCLGVKQPRWPEYHWPKWAKDLSESAKSDALIAYIQAVINRVRDQPAIKSYQLENEALLKNFGSDIDIDRARLCKEFETVCKVDNRPIIMSTSNGWGTPLRRPVPDMVGFSVYTVMYHNGRYRTTIQKPWLHKLRKFIIENFLNRPVFIHELQCEPWGHTSIWKMTPEEQEHSMSLNQIEQNIRFAHKIGIYPIDFWGAEWWYWRWCLGDKTIYQTVEESLIIK